MFLQSDVEIVFFIKETERKKSVVIKNSEESEEGQLLENTRDIRKLIMELEDKESEKKTSESKAQ